MNWVLLFAFVMVAVAMVVPATWRPEYRIQYPCLAGIVVLFLVALPMASLNLHPELVNPSAMTRFSVMAILCLAASWAGYEWPRRGNPGPALQLRSSRLSLGALALVLVGTFFAYKYASIEPEFDPEKAGMTGIATIYLTLARVMGYGFIIAAILFLRTGDWWLLPLMVPQLWSYVGLFTIGRRSPTGEIAIITVLLLYFYRKWLIPAWLLLLGMFAMAIFSYNIGQVRSTVEEAHGDRISSFLGSNPLKCLTLEGMTDDNRHVEIYNASRFMEAKVLGGHYTLGLHFWNQLVFGYVPAQFVGRACKDRLLIPLTDDTVEAGFEKSVGTCESGIAEVFMAFWYFGCLLFFALGYFMRWLWDGSVRGSVIHQFLLLVCILPALMTFSIQFWTFVNNLVSVCVFVGPFLWWSRVERFELAGTTGRKDLTGRSNGHARSVVHRSSRAQHPGSVISTEGDFKTTQRRGRESRRSL